MNCVYLIYTVNIIHTTIKEQKMKIAELKKALSGLSDNAEVVVWGDDEAWSTYDCDVGHDPKGEFLAIRLDQKFPDDDDDN